MTPVARCFRVPETNILPPASVSPGILRETAKPPSAEDLACFMCPSLLMSIAGPPIGTPPSAAAFSNCRGTHRVELAILLRRSLIFTALHLHSSRPSLAPPQAQIGRPS